MATMRQYQFATFALDGENEVLRSRLQRAKQTGREIKAMLLQRCNNKPDTFTTEIINKLNLL